MTCRELCFVGDRCSAVCDSPECIEYRVGGIKTLCGRNTMNLDRDDIFIQDIIEDGIQEYLEACEGERADKERRREEAEIDAWRESR